MKDNLSESDITIYILDESNDNSVFISFKQYLFISLLWIYTTLTSIGLIIQINTHTKAQIFVIISLITVVLNFVSFTFFLPGEFTLQNSVKYNFLVTCVMMIFGYFSFAWSVFGIFLYTECKNILVLISIIIMFLVFLEKITVMTLSL